MTLLLVLVLTLVVPMTAVAVFVARVVLAKEIEGWLPYWIEALVGMLTRLLPQREREFYERVWTAEIAAREDRPVTAVLAFASQIVSRSLLLRWELRHRRVSLDSGLDQKVRFELATAIHGRVVRAHCRKSLDTPLRWIHLVPAERDDVRSWLVADYREALLLDLISAVQLPDLGGTFGDILEAHFDALLLNDMRDNYPVDTMLPFVWGIGMKVEEWDSLKACGVVDRVLKAADSTTLFAAIRPHYRALCQATPTAALLIAVAELSASDIALFAGLTRRGAENVLNEAKGRLADRVLSTNTYTSGASFLLGQPLMFCQGRAPSYSPRYGGSAATPDDATQAWEQEFKSATTGTAHPGGPLAEIT